MWIYYNCYPSATYLEQKLKDVIKSYRNRQHLWVQATVTSDSLMKAKHEGQAKRKDRQMAIHEYQEIHVYIKNVPGVTAQPAPRAAVTKWQSS